VPRISSFYGITIWMYWNEGQHARPHFHARYAGEAASIDLGGELLAGGLSRRALMLVAEWANCIMTSCSKTGSGLAAMSHFSPSIRCRSIVSVEQLTDITAVEVIGEYRLRLTFQDGTVGDVDFATHEWRGVFEPLRDPSYFARVEVDPEAGTIAWPNGVDMAPEPLYEEARRHMARATHAG
jgi:hypothetical protein